MGWRLQAEANPSISTAEDGEFLEKAEFEHESDVAHFASSSSSASRNPGGPLIIRSRQPPERGRSCSMHSGSHRSRRSSWSVHHIAHRWRG